jgi:hypothetical protein
MHPRFSSNFRNKFVSLSSHIIFPIIAPTSFTPPVFRFQNVFPSGLLYDMVWARACKQCSGFYRVTECALPVCDCSTAALKHELVGAVLEGGALIPEDHTVMKNMRSATVLAITHLFDGSSELGELDAGMEMYIRQLKMRLGIIKDE